jgi:hypothetical protein
MTNSKSFSEKLTTILQSQSEKLYEKSLDPIGISIQLSELAPVMNLRQAQKTMEIQSLISQLAISKLRAADKNDRNKYDILEKQQIQAALAGLKIIQEVENAV